MGGTAGHARREQSGHGAAIIHSVYTEAERSALAVELARAFVAGRWRAEDLAERAAGTLDRWPRWLSHLAFAVVATERVAPPAATWRLIAFIEAFLAGHERRPDDGEPPDPPQILRHLPPVGRGLVAVGAASTPVQARRWPVTAVATTDALAELLELSDGQLAWLADVRGLERTAPREQLRNYRYRWVRRRSGRPRLIEAPKARLKETQRWVLREILDQIPAHPTAHGFVAHRSALTNAREHVGRRLVLRLDLRDFFASVRAGRVFGIFRAAGYVPSVAHVLTGLCTNAIPAAVWQGLDPAAAPWLVQPHFWLGRQLATPHLPQGAPTSPSLANLAAFTLDTRMSGLADAFSLHYSRYADDLTFSGAGLTAAAGRGLIDVAETIARDEGFRLNPDKTSVRTRAQRQVVTGVVVNAATNSPRDEYDRLRATLHRLALDGPPAGEEPHVTRRREAQLRGRVAWVAALNPQRGQRLARMLEAVRRTQ